MSGGVKQALDGVNIAIFGGYAAGPWIGKVLANFGATVVHVEAQSLPDGFRLQYPPFKDKKKGINRGATFSYFNDSKQAITLDLKKPGGVELAHRLLDWCDIVIENMRPGVMARLGLGYEESIKTNPDLIMLSTCNMGQTGPRASAPGFGSQLSALAGFCGLTGVAGGPPMLLYGPYIDFIAALEGATVALAALDKRRRTGKGCLIDVAQYECGLSFIAGALLDYHANDKVLDRSGNFDPKAAPHNAYACANDSWIAISCWSDEEFGRLATFIGHPEWLNEEAYATLDRRQANLSDLDEMIGEWCEAQDADALAGSLQEAGIHAYRVNSIADLFTDEQLRHRGTWRKRRHPEIGDQAYYFPGFNLSEMPGDVTSAAPCLGADNDVVYREYLGLSEEEYEKYRSQGVFD
jgi:benzylsuccinate CoA-transferase BbsF subunit